jgi:hypothetical protein
MTAIMIERSIGKKALWVPGENRESNGEFPVPTTKRLREKWQGYLGEGTVLDAPGVFGVVLKPDKPPRGYASVDLCEVVRHTHKALRLVEEQFPPKSLKVQEYGKGLSFEGNSTDISFMVQVLMNKDLVPPVDDIQKIGGIMREWRENDIYVFANTSTLPGCELATIDFFSKHLPGAFDGILFPRNHMGTDPLTKGVAAKRVIQEFPPENGKIIAIKIDDSSHHLDSFDREVGSLPNSTVKTFTPEYPLRVFPDIGNPMDLRSLEAFQSADIFLREKLRNSEQSA